MRIDRHEYFLQMAELVATRSTCFRRSVGCVLVDKLSHVCATGYNGRPSGMPHCNEPTDKEAIFESTDLGSVVLTQVLTGYRDIFGNACPGAAATSGTRLDECEALHAEQNALLQCRDCWQLETAYITVTPCITCLKLLLNTSCRTIVARGIYPNSYLHMWHGNGRQVLILDTQKTVYSSVASG